MMKKSMKKGNCLQVMPKWQAIVEEVSLMNK